MRKGSPSVLPNSCNSILRPIAGGLHVRWHEEMDSHVLYHGENRIAAHHNGFSCHNLAQRMLTGNEDRILAQFEYIADCGGKQFVSPQHLAEITKMLSAP